MGPAIVVAIDAFARLILSIIVLIDAATATPPPAPTPVDPPTTIEIPEPPLFDSTAQN